MATVQTEISFRPRKRTFINGKSKREKENNDLVKKNNRILKRDIKCGESDDESCSPTKVSRLIARQNTTDNILSETKRNQEPLKGLTSRETEISWLRDFLENHLEKKKSASLYISGQPGTGKTASLNYLLQLPEFKNSFRHVYVNCTVMKTAGSIYKRLCSELKLTTTGSSEKASLSAIDKYLSSKHKMTLIVLDEIDQLCNKGQSVLYSIFDWPSRKDANVILIGVANTLDFVPRVLPRLLTNSENPPKTLHFAPYTKQQIIDIFENKIAEENKGIVFAPVALQMIAAKISAISGDIRRALDVAQRVVDIAKKNNADGNTKVTVELKHALEVLDLVYGNPKNIQSNVDEGLPIHQKLILCSLMLMFTKGKTKHVTLNSLYDVYKRVSRGRNITALDMSEFVCTCDLLQCIGALRFGGSKSVAKVGGERRVNLLWAETDLVGALRDSAFLAAVLDDVKCLGP